MSRSSVCKVTIADDDIDVRLLLRVVLKHEKDFKIVAESSTPHDAVSQASEFEPDVVIIDHEFRGYSTNTNAAPKIREQYPNALIVMFNAYDTLRAEILSSEHIDTFILKTDINQLPRIIRDLLEERSSSNPSASPSPSP